MGVQATYLGMPLAIDDLDVENLAYFKHCAAHNFHLQRCTKCNLLRYPPTTACPWCMNPKSDWVPVEAKGAVHSYTEVHHAIQPAFYFWQISPDFFRREAHDGRKQANESLAQAP